MVVSARWDIDLARKCWKSPWHFNVNLRLAKLLEAYGREFPRHWREFASKTRSDIQCFYVTEAKDIIAEAKQYEDPLRPTTFLASMPSPKGCWSFNHIMNKSPKPFEWKFTRVELRQLVAKLQTPPVRTLAA